MIVQSTWILVLLAGATPAVLQENSNRPSPSIARIDEILTRLQHRSDDLKDIRCEVKFVEDDLNFLIDLKKKHGLPVN